MRRSESIALRHAEATELAPAAQSSLARQPLQAGARRAAVDLALAAAVACAGGGSGLPPGLTTPDRGVLCNRDRAICYDRFGPSVGLTEAFLGEAAAESLLVVLRAHPDSAPRPATFSPAPGTECTRGSGGCRAGDRSQAQMTQALYGPWPDRPPGMTAEAAAILEADWSWIESRHADGTGARPSDPEHYLVRLDPAGVLRVRADCNRAGGSYRLDGSTIALEVTHSTLAACGPESLDRVFLRELARATSYFLRHGRLYILLGDSAGSMEFRR